MAYTTKVAEYLRGGGATNDKIDDFFYFCSIFKDGRKQPPEVFYEKRCF